MLFAESPHPAVSLHTHPRLQRARFLVDPGMKHAAVAARGVKAQLVLFLAHCYRADIAYGELPGNRAADNACADDDELVLSSI